MVPYWLLTVLQIEMEFQKRLFCGPCRLEAAPLCKDRFGPNILWMDNIWNQLVLCSVIDN